MRPSRLARGLVSGILVLCTFALPGCDDGTTAPQGGSPPRPTTGSVRVSASVFGNGPDLDGFLVVVGTGLPSDPAPQAVPAEGGTVFFQDLAPGAYEVHLDRLAANCRMHSSEPVGLVLIAGQTALVQIAVLCPATATTEVFARFDWDGNPLVERFFLEEDGTFELDYGSWNALGGEHSGAFSRDVDVYTFAFSNDFPATPMEATGVRDGDCLNVDYNDWMNLSDFADGWYCLE